MSPRRATSPEQDRRDIEGVFAKYCQSLNAADIGLASQVWLQSPDILVVTPVGRYNGWDGVKEIYSQTRNKFSERNVHASNVSIEIAGDAAWLVFDFTFTAKQADGEPLTLNGWESHGYVKTPDGWRIAHLHYSVPAAI